MHVRQSLVESAWLVLCTLWITLLSGPGVEANICPNSYPFYACPRSGDLLKDTVCCRRDSRYTCCTPEYVEGWGVALIVIGCVLVCSCVITVICMCCRKRRRRQPYTAIRDDFLPQQAGVIVVSAPPPPPTQYGYNTMAYPPSNVSLPPPYEPYTAKPAPTATEAAAAQPTQRQQGSNERMSENEEDAV